ncbi:hypothetical protein BGZ73_002830 [Actinomortierella ambigua]|nr:hypothetical protein BGZ73_002830 [Actinomortierella ambigua]
MFQEWTTNIEKARINLGLQGMSVAVVHKNKIIYAQGFGKRNDIDPFTPETLTHIASTTKAFTAAAVGELVADKKARWDVPVNEYLPEFKLKDPRLTAEVNFIDLLAHRTGFPRLDLEWFHRSESRSELIKQLRYVEPIHPLRTEFTYDNIMYAVAGEAAARIAGTSYEQVVLDKVIRPAGMVSSGFSITEMVTRPNHALPYTSKSFEAAKKGQIIRMPVDSHPMSDAPAGDIYSNAIDLARWARVIMYNGVLDGEQVLHEETVKTATNEWNVIRAGDINRTMTYGLGWILEMYHGRRIISHGGSNPGYQTNIVLFPKDEFAIVVLSNNNVNKLTDTIPYYIADSFLDLPKTEDWLFEFAEARTKEMYKLLGGEDPADLEQFFPPQVKDKPATRKLDDFAGEYRHLYGLHLSLKAVESHEKSGEKVTKLAYKFLDVEGFLDHYHYDTFRLRLSDDWFMGSFLLTFMPGHNGSIREVHVLMGPNEVKAFGKL